MEKLATSRAVESSQGQMKMEWLRKNMMNTHAGKQEKTTSHREHAAKAWDTTKLCLSCGARTLPGALEEYNLRVESIRLKKEIGVAHIYIQFETNLCPFCVDPSGKLSACSSPEYPGESTSHYERHCTSSGAALLETVKWGRLLHGHSIVDGFESDTFVGSAIVGFYLKFGEVRSARNAFDRITDPDTVSWNTMVSGLVKNSCFDEALRVFGDMVIRGVKFDSTTLAAVLPAMAELQELKSGMKVHCLAIKIGFDGHEFVVTGLVSLYSKCGDILTSRFLFGHISRPDLVSWNAMISGYSSNGEIEYAVSLFKDLVASGGKVNSSTIVSLIPVFSPFGHFYLSQTIHGFAIKSGFDSNSPVSTALTTIYSRLNEIESARQLFDEAPEKSLPSWNAMISGYAQNGLTETAISLFKKMQLLEVQPNPVTITSILSACAQFGTLSFGKWVHELVTRENFQSNTYVSTALIDMYAKCGSIKEAQRLFDNMTEKNVVSWNTMISGYGLHGLGHEALRLFYEMIHSGVVPTAVTFVSVLYSCSHAGLVNEGDKIFKSMVRDHGIHQGPEHFACMVDLFGRSGKLEEALEFINQMPVEPGSAVWGALLGSCMIHKNTTLAQLASDNLLKLEPENVGYQVLLSNIHSTNQNYSEAAIIRDTATKKMSSKTPGCTLLEIGEAQYIFTSGDRSQPQSTEIYAVLEKLMAKMREAGFQTETETALHDVEEEEKEQMVNVHSEKLAIAFALISSSKFSFLMLRIFSLENGSVAVPPARGLPDQNDRLVV
ncbi:hypothetical protein GIB67_007875 [Kingdonia uniflora]|uniref:DYW domain-containing protein n=1 Tax=Kingdonia uniflora TaxID=39325 RepID=A0A7J7PB42_9MAGN|nr:hypothetical protein GIB67_007875 [Kingdonia uniflora]